MNNKNVLILLLSFTTLLFSQVQPETHTTLYEEEASKEYIAPLYTCYTFQFTYADSSRKTTYFRNKRK